MITPVGSLTRGVESAPTAVCATAFLPRLLDPVAPVDDAVRVSVDATREVLAHKHVGSFGSRCALGIGPEARMPTYDGPLELPNDVRQPLP